MTERQIGHNAERLNIEFERRKLNVKNYCMIFLTNLLQENIYS